MRVFEEEVSVIYTTLKKISKKYGPQVFSLLAKVSNPDCRLPLGSNQIRTMLEDCGFIFYGSLIIDAEPCSLAYYFKKKVVRVERG